MKIIKENSGFTLIEVLVSMSIFVVFVGILINSYSSIVKAYNEANEYRKMYVEARNIFDSLTREIRDGIYDYNDCDGHLACQVLISKDGQYRTTVSYSDPNLSLKKCKLAEGLEIGVGSYNTCVEETLNSELQITKFNFLASPNKDPYAEKNVNYDDIQFQPMITIYAEFTKENPFGDDFSFPLQTTISSRIYNQIYEKVN